MNFGKDYIMSHKSYFILLIAMIAIIISSIFFFKNPRTINVVSLILLILFYSIVKKEDLEGKLEKIVPLIVILLVASSPYFINLIKEKPYAKIQLIRYDVEYGENYHITNDLWNMYLIYTGMSNPAMMQMKNVQTADYNEQVPHGRGLVNRLDVKINAIFIR